jgi:hypothetical protein
VPPQPAASAGRPPYGTGEHDSPGTSHPHTHPHSNPEGDTTS